jgi:hypothetical protein
MTASVKLSLNSLRKSSMRGSLDCQMAMLTTASTEEPITPDQPNPRIRRVEARSADGTGRART